MIQIITRVRHKDLYKRMVDSARATKKGPVNCVAIEDDGSPKLAESYNLMAAVSPADVLLFCHDDVIFLSEGWDEKITDAMALGFNLIGAVGSQEYAGGMVFDAGREFAAGKVVGWVDGKRVVKLMANRSEVEPVKVVDGMLMAVDRAHFLKIGGFDMAFDGLFYYDTDLCLRSNCAVADFLVAHEKPKEHYGKYPADLKPIEAYRDAFNAKHGFKADPKIGDQRCDTVEYREAACL
jgi:hypothetical protein